MTQQEPRLVTYLCENIAFQKKKRIEMFILNNALISLLLVTKC